ncbi:MAG: aminotransferase class I/II-fold pyridoxal phosphate-dependent enzyme [Candidatus Eremiobacteraeota bacterium]|nr:aminotransferase class I/II-fold pyridoxal phosphate-dependent enzyme [Candidatus Eremiobacteraeota bacterium]
MTSPSPTRAIEELAPTRPFVAPEELARRAGHASLLRLGANESAFGPPPRALEAMRAELPRVSWYGDPESTELRAALAARHGCGFENIVIGSGIDELLGLAVRAFLAPGDVSVATLGTYPTYSYHVAGFGARLETAPYAADGRVQLDTLAGLAHATGARVAYLANPDNPSGSFAARDAVARFRDALPAQCLLLLDEAYGDFVAPAELLGETLDPRVLRMRTFSKAFGLAGARIAYAVGSAQAIAAFGKIRLQYGVNRTAQIGALAALREDAFVANVVAEVARGRAEYAALAAEAGLRSLPSRTNFTCIEIGSRGAAERMVEELLRLAVFVRKPGAAPLDGFVRVTVGTERERESFAAAFREAIRALPAQSALR